MDHDLATQAKDLHRTLEFIGLRAQATSVGLIQLCAELVKAGILDDSAVQRIKDAIYREITVTRPRSASNAEFDKTLKQRLDAIFPCGKDAVQRAPVGDVREMVHALEPDADDQLG